MLNSGHKKSGAKEDLLSDNLRADTRLKRISLMFLFKGLLLFGLFRFFLHFIGIPITDNNRIFGVNINSTTVNSRL